MDGPADPAIEPNSDPTMVNLLAFAALAVWIYLLTARGGFWMAAVRDEGGPLPLSWPKVTAVIPARNEADGIGETIGSLLRQDYPGAFSIVLVDDHSDDGTADVARRAAAEASAADRLTVIVGRGAARGLDRQAVGGEAGHRPGRGRASADLSAAHRRRHRLCSPTRWLRLVAQAQSDKLVLTSLMAQLRCESFAERALIPAFIFFFQMLYPFAWVNRPRPPDRGGGRRLHAGARATRCARPAASRASATR